MSTIKSFDDASRFLSGCQPSARCCRASAGRCGSTATALNDGLAAARAYNELTRRGVPHDAAVRQIFDAHFDA